MAAPPQSVNPVYSLIIDDVISGPHVLRVDEKLTTEPNTKQETSNPKESKKPKTRIPTRLRQAVEKLQHGGVDRGAGDPQAVQQVPQHPPRRSSIPKQQQRDIKQAVKPNADPKPEKPDEVPNKDLDIPKAEEEFEKIYDEIIEDKSIEYMDAIVLPDSKIDPELETNFEDIIHAYDEGKIEPLHEENTSESQKSRIPIIKQKSLDESKDCRHIKNSISLEEKVNGRVNFNDKMPIEQPVQGIVTKEVNKEKDPKERHHSKLSKIIESEQSRPKNSEILNNTVPSTETKLEQNFASNPDAHKHEKKQSDWFKPIDLTDHPSLNKPERPYFTRDPLHTSTPRKEGDAPDAVEIKSENDSIKENITNENATVSIANGDTENITQPEKISKIENATTEASKDIIPDSNSPDIYLSSRDLNKVEDHKMKNEEIKEETLPIRKGNVNRLISKISQVDSNDSQKEQDGRKIEEEEDLPKPKSVLTKIAMFETIEPKRPKYRPHTIKPKSKVPDRSPRTETLKYEVISPTERPRIIEEVLKTPPVRRKSHEDIIDNTQEFRPEDKTNVKIEPKINGPNQNGATFDPNIVHTVDKSKILTDKSAHNLENIHADIVKKEKSVDNSSNKSKDFRTESKLKPVENCLPPGEKSPTHDNILTDFKLKTEPHKVDYLSSTETHESSRKENLIENRLRRLKSATGSDNTKLERSKSIVDIEIEKSVKGKVFNIIQNMTSNEVLETPKKDVISVKERPRKKSVSEKIALFERKMTPISMEEVLSEPEKTPSQERTIESARVDTTNRIPDQEALKLKIAELNGAKAKYGSVSDMPTFELSNGMKMPVLAVGTALLEPELIKPIIGAAIDLGYRAIDTAYIYGNEKLVGEAVRAKVDDGTVKREELFIMSKLWSTFHRPDLVEKACRASLDSMGLDYFDLYMIHNPMSFKESGEPLPTIAGVLQFSVHEYVDAWAPLEELLAQGLVRALGVANFNSEQVARVFGKAVRKPVVNQVECHPYLNQQRLSDFCAVYGVRLSCYGTLGSRGTPAAYKSPGAASALDEPVVKEAAAQVGVSPAEILIRYQLERGHAVVAKASTAVHLWQNLQALRVRLAPQQMAALQTLNKNRRNFLFKGMGDTHKNYPFNIPF